MYFIFSILGGALVTLILYLVFLSFQVDVAFLFGFDNSSEVSFLSDLVMPLVSTFVGAAVGALLVYFFQLAVQRKIQISNEVEIFNKGILALESQLSDLASLKRMMILPVEDKLLRFMEMPGTAGGSVEERLPADISLPLIRLKATDLVMRCRMAERQYFNVIALRKDFEAARVVYLDRLSSGGVAHLDVSSLNKKFSLAGAEVIAQLYVFAEGFITQLDGALEDLRVAIDKLSDLFSDAYPKGEYIGVKLEIISQSEYIFSKTAPPKIGGVGELFELAGYFRKIHDPVDDEVYSITRLARRNWSVAAYSRVFVTVDFLC